MTTIKFGTSGWRGIIARDFTFDNVRLATQGIADYSKATLTSQLSTLNCYPWLRHAVSRARIFAGCCRGAHRQRSDSSALRPRHAHTGHRAQYPASQSHWRHQHGPPVTIPPEYQGLKFSTSNGAPATPEVTGQIEANIVKLQAGAGRSKRGHRHVPMPDV